MYKPHFHKCSKRTLSKNAIKTKICTLFIHLNLYLTDKITNFYGNGVCSTIPWMKSYSIYEPWCHCCWWWQSVPHWWCWWWWRWQTFLSRSEWLQPDRSHLWTLSSTGQISPGWLGPSAEGWPQTHRKEEDLLERFPWVNGCMQVPQRGRSKEKIIRVMAVQFGHGERVAWKYLGKENSEMAI